MSKRYTWAIYACGLALIIGSCGNNVHVQGDLKIESFTLINTDTNEPIATFDPLAPNAILNLATLPTTRLNLRANTSPAQVGSVRFTLHQQSQLDSDPPYTLTAGNEGDDGAWTPSLGRHQLIATPYPQTEGRGDPGQSSSLSFEVVQESNPTPSSEVPHTLLASYRVQHEQGPRYDGMTYRPRQFDLSPYKGWDVLTLPGGDYRTYTGPAWLNLTLNRDATLIVIWDGAQPGSWLESWQEVAALGGKRVFKKVFAAGEAFLGAIEGAENQPYTVLLAEADGLPSAAPTVPEGLEEPKPNLRCPTWVHDQYRAEGSDGRMYPSWHPQIDPRYWCYIGHWHGSSGDLLFPGFKPVYNYAEAHGGPPEAHEGFTGLVANYLSTEGRPYRLYKETHAETGLHNRVCTETHSHRMVLYDVTAERVVLDLHWKPSFGPSRNAGTFEAFRPSSCHENATIPSTLGARNIPRITNGGYESWQFEGDPYSQLGIYGRLTVAYLDPMTKCSDAQCNTVETTGETNTRLWMITPGVDKGEGWGADASKAFAEGTFYTDIYGNKQLSATDPGAIRQYVDPGLEVEFLKDDRFFSEDAWLNAYIDTSVKERHQPLLELEDGLDETE